MAIAMTVWISYRSRMNRIDRIRSQVELINARILNAYDDDIDPLAFLRFVDRFYVENPMYDHIRISAYYNGKLLYNVGEPINLNIVETKLESGITNHVISDIEEDRRNSNFYYDVASSNDKRLIVYTMLPFDSDIKREIHGSSTVFILMFGIACLGTLMAFWMSRRLGRDISLLRNFALRAGSDPGFVPSKNFSHDELGDISRQLVRLFNERNGAIIKIKREHNVAMHALEDKARLKRELTNNINHELKTPIGVIKGYIDTIREHPEMDDESRNHFLSKVNEHIDRLIQLMNDLSSITRLEFGSQMINLEPIDFHEIVFRAVNDYESSGSLGNMVFNYDIPTYCRVIGNESLLTGMLNNLTKNAVFYSKGTECNLILTGQDDTHYHFAFYDNGVGVKESSLPHLFERFFREDMGRSRKKGGTGLGLPIVLNTVEALGGTISASNREGGGLLFRFTLRKAPETRDQD
ncbi:MAG: HAMP domain-containing sensor histidine kinase [Bacteroidales bacterium]|nr:HAMP domain-containing sensor histidine kinase [Bacteroidales bacterium]